MSVNLEIRSVTDTVIEEIKANPVKLYLLLHPGWGYMNKDEIKDEQDNFEEIYDRKLTDADKKLFVNWKPNFPNEQHPVQYFSVIHYLLSGGVEWRTGAFPLNFLLGERIQLTENTNFFTSKDVKEINQALSQISEDDIKRKFETNVSNSTDLKVSSWKEDNIRDIIKDFNGLKVFVSSLSQKNLGMCLTIS